jgi:hypothetical protein
LYASRPATFSVPLTSTLVDGSIAARNFFAAACGSYVCFSGAISGLAGCAACAGSVSLVASRREES